MLTPSDLANTATTADDPRPKSAARTVEVPPDELVNFEWPHVGWGIILAGAAYPLVVGAIFTIIALIAAIAGGIGPIQLIGGLVLLLVFASCSAAIGAVWASMVVLIVLPIVYLFVWSLKLRGSMVWLGAVSGGLVGVLAVTPFLDLFYFSSPARMPDVMLFLMLGPGLATVMGQIGGAWGGRNSAGLSEAAYRRALRAATLAQRSISLQPLREAATEPETSRRPRFQFGIRHLLWTAVWLSLLLSVIRLSGIPFEIVLPLLAGWLVFQAATLWLGWLLVRRLGPWWRARRQRRST